MKKKITGLFLVLAMVACLTACGQKETTYASESGAYTVTLYSDNTCKWYQDDGFFEGTYSKTDDGYQLDVKGDGWYGNTVFEAVKDGDDLIITGGIVDGERFVKE